VPAAVPGEPPLLELLPMPLGELAPPQLPRTKAHSSSTMQRVSGERDASPRIERGRRSTANGSNRFAAASHAEIGLVGGLEGSIAIAQCDRYLKIVLGGIFVSAGDGQGDFATASFTPVTIDAANQRIPILRDRIDDTARGQPGEIGARIDERCHGSAL
jgi:hypothetical protein